MHLAYLFAWTVGLVASDGIHAQNHPDLTKPAAVVPDKIPGVITLTAEQVIKQILAHPEMVIIDARITADRKYGYIESSLSLPDIKTTCDTLKQFIHNKATPILFYCNGIKCGRSVISIKIARNCGYSQLLWFRGGFEEWMKKGYPYIKE